MNQARNLLQESLVAIERLQARVQELEGRGAEPIAIVGASCRFPGANDPQALWELLRDRKDMVRDLPPGRWDAEQYYAPLSDQPGKMVSQRAGFLDGLDLFDPHFFSISSREAMSLDPQHRLLLETAQEAIESAGVATDRLLRSRTGVFVGISTTEYQQMMLAQGLESLDIYAANGGALNTAAGRVAFVYGFEGPAMAVDTACSSSLVAVHLAVQSLRRGETDLALASGVNVVLQPTGMVLFSQWGLMAPDGACKVFDDRADGFVRAEGCGTIVLKRLSEAIAADDPILAVVRGTAVNSDGRSSGLTVPHGPSQEAVIRAALSDARLQPRDVDYIESHGTGTSLGDPIEMEAIGAVMKEGRDAAHPVVVGAVKSNIGHGEASAGMAGLLKIVMSLQNEAIPPNIHFSAPSRRIDWASLPVTVPTEAVPWPRQTQRLRRAGVSGFGFSGTNAHIVLEEAPPRREKPAGHGRPGLVVISARTPEALAAQAARYAADISAHPDRELSDYLTTLASGRAHLQRRVAFPVASLDEVRHGLEALASGTLPAGASQGVVRPGEPPRVAFLFSGQGSQYAGMGRELYRNESVFRAEIDRCAEILSASLDVDLRTLVFSDEHGGRRLSETAYTQPALFAFEYALATFWRSIGLNPSVVAGHSVGEYVAACLAGVFSVEEGLRLVATRGRLMQELPAGGAMAAVFAAEDAVDGVIAAYGERLAKAAVNGPEEIVISGERQAVCEVVAEFRARGAESRELDVSHAFHSALLDPMLNALEDAARKVVFKAPRIQLVSNLTGRPFSPGSGPDAQYWRRHAREPVRFLDTLRSLAASEVGVVVEIGPHPTLVGLAGRALPAAPWKLVKSLRKGRVDTQEIIEAIRDLHVAGAELDWATIASGWGGQRVSLPPYPFQRERHWLSDATPASSRSGTHGLLGARIDLANDPQNRVWETDISLDLHPWLGDHLVQGSAIVPATAYIEIGLAAGREILGQEKLSIRNFVNLKPLVLAKGSRVRLQTTLSADGGNYHLRVYSRDASQTGHWIQHVSASVSLADLSKTDTPIPDLPESLKGTTDPLGRAAFYSHTAAQGNQWGPAFQGLAEVWRSEGEALARIEVRPEIARTVNRFCFHPALSDACGHALVALTSLADEKPSGAFVGGGVAEIVFHRRPPDGVLWAHASLRTTDDPEDRHAVFGDVRVYGSDGALVTETIGARLWYLDERSVGSTRSSDILYAPTWTPRAIGGGKERGCGDGTWLVLGNGGGVADEIAAVCRERGRRCVVVQAGDNVDFDQARPNSESPFVAAGPCAAIIDLTTIGTDERVAPEQTLRLMQSLPAGPRAGTRIWLVTSGTQAIGQTPVRSIAGAALWGLGRTLSVEQADSFGGLIDLDPDASPGLSARFIAREIQEGDPEDMVAFRGSQRWVPRLARMARPSAAFKPRSDATYVLTGGLGGIALAIASWLVQRGARHLVLVGRTPLPPRSSWHAPDLEGRVRDRINAVVALEEAGADVEIVCGDIAQDGLLASVVRQRRDRRKPPIAGAFHTAGVVDFVPLCDETADGFRARMAAKVAGALQLESALAAEPVEHFVLFSSTSTQLRSPLLGSYAAANAALDALACRRSAQGLPALSINWGTWSEVGMAVEVGKQGRAEMLTGIATLSTSVALAALESLMAEPKVRAVVMPVDWAALGQAYPQFAADPYLQDLIGTGRASLDGSSARSSVPELSGLSDADRREAITLYLRGEVAQALGVAAERLDVSEELSGRGFDSLMAVQVKARVEKDLGISLSMLSLLRGPSLEELSSIVTSALAERLAAVPGSGAADADEAWEEGTL